MWTWPYSGLQNRRHLRIVVRYPYHDFIMAVVVARRLGAQRRMTVARKISAINETPRTPAAQRRRKTQWSYASPSLQLLRSSSPSKPGRAFWSRSACLITRGGCARGVHTTIRGRIVISCSRVRICTGLEATMHRYVFVLNWVTPWCPQGV